jgi:Regulator of ribonuclease activity B
MKTRRTFLACLGAIAFMAAMGEALSQSTRRIPLAQLEEMFKNMRAQTKWNVDGPLLWGYFFIDPSRAKLKQFASVLEGAGYRVVGLEQVSGEKVFRLHAERIETHSPASLDARNRDLNALAEKHLVASYDGMDVGPIPGALK